MEFSAMYNYLVLLIVLLCYLILQVAIDQAEAGKGGGIIILGGGHGGCW